MKKIIALALSLLMVLGCVSAMAETADKEVVTMMGAFSIETDKVPEYYKMEVLVDTEMEFMAELTSEDPAKPLLVLVMSFSDEWAGYESLADASEEDMIAVKDSFYEVTELDEGSFEFRDATTGEGTPVLIARANDGSVGALYTVFKSHEIEIDLFPGEDEEPVTDEEIDTLLSFLTDMKFIYE